MKKQKEGGWGEGKVAKQMMKIIGCCRGITKLFRVLIILLMAYFNP